MMVDRGTRRYGYRQTDKTDTYLRATWEVGGEKIKLSFKIPNSQLS